MILTGTPVPNFGHLQSMTNEHGLFEHADHSQPRREHGYCVDDAARALVVVCREPRPAPNVYGMARRYLDFVLAALAPNGTCHNRMSIEGAWTDEPGLGDWWGRAIWGLGAAAIWAPTAHLQASARAGFQRAAKQQSPNVHAMAFAGLGAAQILARVPGDPCASGVLRAAIDTMWWDDCEDGWPWPEPRLRYGNGALAEAMLLGGDLLPDDQAFSRGLEMLAFLLDVETFDGHLSLTPVGGRGPGESQLPGDQQPIEVAAIADACASAYRITHEQRWLDGIDLAWRWFLGANDAQTAMFDPTTGAGFDGLEARGRNANQGAESTLAMLSTAQHARWLITLR